MKTRLSVMVAAIALAACSKPVDTSMSAAVAVSATAASTPAPTGIAWRHAANDADVDAALALARRERKPVFLYWGATWCPPCNQVKATLFNRVDFIERSRAFVPVYIDGDSPGAQKLGARFKVVGYPTMVLFSPEGTELTRLPGEVDAAQYTQVLTLGMNAQRPVKAVLADATRGGAGLTPNDWKLLAFYAWGTDEQQLVPKAQLPSLFKQLATTCPADQAETSARLLLQALAASDIQTKRRIDAESAPMQRVLAVLADDHAARAHMDVLSNNADEIVRALSNAKTPERMRLVDAFDAAMKTLQADTSLSRADRLTALQARVALAKIDAPPDAKKTPGLPAPLLADLRGQVAKMDREITDGYERQAVITEAAYLLEEAGLPDESDALLKANLAKSHSPYYLMSELASNAKKRGDTAAALDWSRQAFERAEGPATRLQWGASYVSALVDLAPQEESRIEGVSGQLLDEAAAQPNAFYERSGRSLQRVGSKLLAWNKGRSHAAVLSRLRSKLDGVCALLPAGDVQQRGVCEHVLLPAPVPIAQRSRS